MMIKEVLKYQGNANYICILCSNEKDELILFYALTGKLSIETNRNKDLDNYNHKIIAFSHTITDCEVKIPIEATKNAHLFHIIKLDSEKEYEHICAVVESLV